VESAQKISARRDDRQPDVEVALALPSISRHAARREACRADSKALSPFAGLSNTEGRQAEASSSFQRLASRRITLRPAPGRDPTIVDRPAMFRWGSAEHV
jgi:hypothetical protein